MPSPRLGTICPATWRALLAGKSGIGLITRFDASGLPIRIAGEVKNFTLDPAIDPREARRMSLNVRYALNAVLEATRAAELDMEKEDPEQVGVIFGSGSGGLDLIFEQHDVYREKGPRRVAPTLIANMIGDAASGYIAIQLNAQGPNMGIVAACSTGGHNVGEAYETIKRGDAEVIISGSSEAPIHPTIMASFTTMRGLADDNEQPERACKPFDARRDGFILSEGAGALVLESLDHALARGAPIIAELIGYGNSNDARDMVAADENGAGAARAMKMAIRKAGIAPEAINYINAHGTGTPLNDSSETQRDQDRFRRACAAPGDQLDQVDARPYDGRGRLGRGADLRAGDPRGLYPADDQPRTARPALRPRLCAECDARGARGHGAVELDRPGRA